jgi:hypothetical protein
MTDASPADPAENTPLELNIRLEGANAARVRRLKEKTEAEDWDELISIALGFWEAAINKHEAIVNRGGVLYLEARFPNGSSERSAVFGEDEGQPERLN